MVELAFRGRKISKPQLPKKQFPYTALAGIIALIALIPLIGVLGLPAQGPSLTLAGQSTLGSGPTVVERPCASLPNDPNLLTLFPIETNSNIGSISLDRNVPVLTICASGSEGSSGFSHILVPKNILGKRLIVTLDDQPVNARVQDFGNYNLVSLEYHHSERTIKITGENEIMPVSPVPTNYTQPREPQEQQQQQQQQLVVIPGIFTAPAAPIDPPAYAPAYQPPTNPCLPYTRDSLVTSGIPVIFTPGERPTFSKDPAGSGIRIQTSTRAVVNFVSDVGETTGIVFKLKNFSTEPSLIRIKIFSSDSLLVDLVQGKDIDTVRPISFSEYIAQVKGSATNAELETRVTAITSGFHPFIFEIRPLLEQSPCN